MQLDLGLLIGLKMMKSKIAMRSLPFLRGKRVFLRLATIDDISQIISFYHINTTHFEQFASPKSAEFYTNEFWKSKIITAQQDFQNDKTCNLFILNLDRNIIGYINFFAFIRGAFYACILGYGLAESEQGKGLMSEALTLAIEYVFKELNVHRIMANYSPNNQRSGKLLAGLILL